MNDFKFVSEDYFIHHTQNYRLSIQINPDGFSALMSGENGKILQIIHRQAGSLENTRSIFRTEESFIKLRELSFQKITIVVNSAHCSLLPPGEEVSSNPMLVHQTDFPATKEGSFIIGNTPNDKVHIAFQISDSLRDFVAGFHNKPRVEHFASRFIEYVPSGKQQEVIVLYSSPGLLHFSFKATSEIKFYNCFECRNDDEILYHIMNTLQNLEYPTSTEIYYAGHLVKKQGPGRLLNSYLPELKILPNLFPFELSWDAHENYFTFLMTD